MTLFYDNLQRICEERGTKISPLVQSIGLDKSTGTNWKKRQSPPDEDIMRQLAQILGVKISDFFKDENERSYHEELVAFENIRSELMDELDEFEESLLEVYNSLGTRDKAEFMQMVYNFAAEKGVDL